jgi:peptidoglycan/LPS O-acetylase OafA/YrhL
MSNTKLEKLHYIDALRGLAILMVLMHHSAQQGLVKMPHVLSVFLSLGTRGVQLFFIASAFTLFRSHQNRNGIERSPLKNFFIRRFFRIAPIYYLGIVYYVLRIIFNLPYWLGNQPYVSISNIFSNVFFVHGFNPYWINSLVPGGWSIAVEMVFYAIFPFLFTWIKNSNGAFIFLNITLLIKLVFQEFFHYFTFISEPYLWREFLFYYLPCQLPIFALGIILFFLIEDINNIKLVSPKVLFLFLILLPLQVGSTFDFLYLNHIVFGILFVIFGVVLSKGKLRFISNPILRYIGKISFSMYIIHFIVISWLTKFHLIDFCDYYLMNFSLRFLLILLISMFISTISYHLIEIPFQNLAKKIILKRESNLLIFDKKEVSLLYK